jgi:hypothetical protein
MSHIRIFARGLIALALVALLVTPASAKGNVYTTGFTRWRAADGGFSSWQRSGVSLAADGSLQFDLQTAQAGSDPYPAGGYNGRNFYNGGNFVVGEALSPVTATSFGFLEAIASWNAVVPTGSWIETQIRAQLAGRWTKWYNLGIWAADDSTIERHSVNLQGDGDGFVAVDTLVLTDKKVAASAYQLKVRLFSETGAAIPSVRNMSVAISATPAKPGALTPGNPARWNRTLEVPECSQMVYPDGGEVWCSPTSTSMVLGYWSQDTGPCEPRVRAAVEGVFDWVYDGHGNWPFNTAYAAAQGMEGYVARFTSLAQAERWIAAGVPLVMSIAWKKGDITGSTIDSTNGHLLVLVGFDSSGNPIINDPAGASDAAVRVKYLRSEFEPLWLGSSGGTVYLIYPSGWAVPPL